MDSIDFSLQFTTDTGIRVSALFTGTRNRPVVTVFATMGDGPSFTVEVRDRTLCLYDTPCERSTALAVINAARIASTSDDSCDLACEIVRDCFVAILEAWLFNEIATALRGCIVCDLSATDHSERQLTDPQRSALLSAFLSDCDPVSGEEYGTGA
jgi:hypothetical protein